MGQLELLEPAEYLSQNKYGYFSILTSDNGVKRQSPFTLDCLEKALTCLDPTKDTWISQNQFLKPNRRAVNVARMGLLFVDLDTYTSEMMKHRNIDSQLNALYWHLEDLEIPKPSLVIHSGRGLQLKWLLEYDIPRGALPRWNLMQKTLVNKLKHLGADSNAKDVSRVLRVVETVNTKSNKKVFVLDRNSYKNGELVRYNFELLAETLLPVAREDLYRGKKHNIKIISKNTRVSTKALNPMKLAWDRLNDLRTLTDLRGGVQEGERMQHLFWRINFLLLSGATRPNLMYNEAVTLAQELDPKWDYSSRELITLYMRAKQHEEGKKVTFLGKEYSPLYTPKNDFLIDLFEINPTEEMKLTTIISHSEKNRRGNENKTEKRRQEGVVERQIYLRQADVKKQRSIELRKTGLSYAIIASELGCSKASIINYCKINNKGSKSVPTTNMA